MHHTIYQILRDTGRRPGEVVSLHLDCLEVIDGQHNLIYDNHKAGRMRRRLPITTDTAEVDHHLAAAASAAASPTSPGPLAVPQPPAPRPAVPRAPDRARRGPGVQGLGRGRSAPSTPSCSAPTARRPRSTRAWSPHTHYATATPNATPMPGSRSTCCSELMDHVAVATTMGYYRVGLKRKQQAIRSVGSLATDAAGNPAPFTSPTAYQRASVSVPFGNCTEPSNVKAGGGACPIRFQCAGCGFYRPDPSYLPALEQHIAALRADRETAAAIGAADYVIANLTARDPRLHRRRRHDAPPARRTRPRRTRRGRAGQQTPAPGPGRPAATPDRNTASTTGAAG